MSRPSAWSIIVEIIFALFGLLIAAGGLGRNGRWYMIPLGLAIAAWSVVRIFSEVEDSGRSGRVAGMSDEREEIRKRMKGDK